MYTRKSYELAHAYSTIYTCTHTNMTAEMCCIFATKCNKTKSKTVQSVFNERKCMHRQKFLEMLTLNILIYLLNDDWN